MRRVLPIALAGLTSFSLVRWWPAAQTIPQAKPLPSPAPVAAAEISRATPQSTQESTGKTQKVRERFTSNLKRRDPFGSAERLLREIDAMTADDFRKLVQEKDWPSPGTYGFDQEFADAFGDALVERWLAVDPDGAVQGMFALSKSMKFGSSQFAGADDMLEALARVRPELFLAESFKDSPTRSLDVIMHAAFQSMATRDVAAARRLSDSLPRPEQRKTAELAIAVGVAQSDPVAAVALARGSADVSIFRAALSAAAEIGPGILGQVLEANDGKFTADSLTPLLMFRYPDLPWDRLAPEKETGAPNGIEINVLNEAFRLDPADRERILTQLQHLPSTHRQDAVGAILQGWVAEDPKSAIEWMAAHEEPSSREASDSMRGVFNTWMRSDKNGALAWFNTLPPSQLRDHLSNDAAIPLAASGDLEKALALFRPIPGKEGESAIVRMAAVQATSNPARAAEWCASLPADIDVSEATQSVVTKWFSKDAAAAAQWVEALPKGHQREAALKAYAQAASTQDPEAAGAWAAAITDPSTRARAAHQVFTSMFQADQAAAIKWVREFPGLDERVRESVLRINAP